MTLQEKREFQRAFFRKAGHNAEMFRMAMDCVPGVAFNMKDNRGRIVALNRFNCDICNFRDELDAVGRTSAELFPDVLARAYMTKDRAVLERGEPVLKEPQPYPADRSARDMIASRFPLHDKQGRVIGTACVYYMEPLEGARPTWEREMKRVTAFIDRHYAENLTIARLAAHIHTSPSNLHRQFQRIMGITPSDYLTTIRLNAARQLLETTDRLITDIAQSVGFYDHSHFTKAFKKARSLTPGEYRRLHRP